MRDYSLRAWLQELAFYASVGIVLTLAGLGLGVGLGIARPACRYVIEERAPIIDAFLPSPFPSGEPPR